MGQTNLAIADLDSVIRIDQYNENAYYIRGVIYSGRLRFSQAIADFTRVIELNPLNASAYMNRGVTYMTTGDNMMARNDFNMVLELSTDPVLTHSAQTRLNRL